MRDCRDCVHCTYVWGFMCTCHVSYDEERDGVMWHVQNGKDVHRKFANKCEHYSEHLNDRDREEIFVL